MGYYNCSVPQVIQRNLLENSGWYVLSCLFFLIFFFKAFISPFGGAQSKNIFFDTHQPFVSVMRLKIYSHELEHHVH